MALKKQTEDKAHEQTCNGFIELRMIGTIHWKNIRYEICLKDMKIAGVIWLPNALCSPAALNQPITEWGATATDKQNRFWFLTKYKTQMLTMLFTEVRVCVCVWIKCVICNSYNWK